MNIREYLFYSQMTVEDLANQIGITRWYLDRIINRGILPSRKLCDRIKLATGGQVPIPAGLHAPSRRTKFRKAMDALITIEIK